MRLIDADALIRKFKTASPMAIDGRARQMVEEMPTIAPKKGKWIETDDGWDGVYYECSCCKEAFTLIDGTPTDNLYNYCPNCGSYNGGEQP